MLDGGTVKRVGDMLTQSDWSAANARAIALAAEECSFGSLKAGKRRVEWYRYGDSNPGPVAENHVS